MKSKKSLGILILFCTILLISAGCNQASDKQKTNTDNMGNMDHSKMNMNDTTKK